jgi:3D (Asp-Asp-Asp) domain-containing protein
LIKKPTFMGSTLSVLLLFSIISYAQTLVQSQEPKDQPAIKSAQNQNQTSGGSSTTTDAVAAGSPADNSGSALHIEDRASDASNENGAAAQMYTATAYSLRGRTASGVPVSRGLIAADPNVLPLGTRVRLEAGTFSGEYVVADTGGTVRGRRIDIWTPSVREAMRFGRRHVKLTVLSFGTKRKKADSSRSAENEATTSANPEK